MAKDTPEYDKPAAIVLKTRELLERYSKSIPEVYKETGIPIYWLKSFSDGRYKQNPSINRVVYLYEYLTGKPLEV